MLDTHVLLWLGGGAADLGRAALASIDEAFAKDRVAVAAISFWEVGMLVQKQRVEVSKPLEVWRNELLDAGLEEWPIDGLVGIRAAELSDFHGDPADRLIVSSALAAGCPLVTADIGILDWKGQLRVIDARR